MCRALIVAEQLVQMQHKSIGRVVRFSKVNATHASVWTFMCAAKVTSSVRIPGRKPTETIQGRATRYCAHQRHTGVDRVDQLQRQRSGFLE